MGKALIILVLLVVLAGAVFTFAAMGDAGNAERWQSRIDRVFGGLIADDLTPGDLSLKSGSCFINGAVLTVPAGVRCTLRIAPSDQRLRRGALQVGRGSVQIQATQSDYGGPAKVVTTGKSYNLNVEDVGETVSLRCQSSASCRLVLGASS